MQPDPLSATFFAISDPTRRSIIARLSLGEATVGELAGPFDISLAAVSKHLKILEGAGLISRSREAQWRRCRLRAEPLRQIADWLGGYQEFWERNLDSLDHYLGSLNASADSSGVSSK